MPTSLNDLVSSVRQQVAGVPANAALSALRDALRLFCDETGAYRADMAGVTITTAQDYDLTAPTKMIIRRVEGLYLQSAEEETAGERGQLVPETAYEIVDDTPPYVHLKWVPAGTEGKLVAVLALSPAIDNVADFSATFINRWYEAITQGALSDLLARPRRWRNTRGAAVALTLFNTWQARAKTEARRGLKRGQVVMGA